MIDQSTGIRLDLIHQPLYSPPCCCAMDLNKSLINQRIAMRVFLQSWVVLNLIALSAARLSTYIATGSVMLLYSSFTDLAIFLIARITVWNPRPSRGGSSPAQASLSVIVTSMWLKSKKAILYPYITCNSQKRPSPCFSY